MSKEVIGSDNIDVLVGKTTKPNVPVLAVETRSSGREVFVANKAVAFVDTNRQIATIALLTEGLPTKYKFRSRVSMVEVIEDLGSDKRIDY